MLLFSRLCSAAAWTSGFPGGAVGCWHTEWHGHGLNWGLGPVGSEPWMLNRKTRLIPQETQAAPGALCAC